MQSAFQPYTTAGVAIVGASLIAVTPVAAPLPGNSIHDVALTADGDSTSGPFFDPFIDPFNTASDNATQLLHNFGLAPGVGLQQAIVNQAGFLQEFFNDPTSSTLADITGQTQDNLKSVITGFTGIDMSDATQSTVFAHTLEGLRSTLIGFIGGFLPPSIDPATVTTLLDFLSSPLSGIIIGELGPFISPFVALSNSISDGDGFSETLANTVGAFFNGADLNLDSVASAINDAGVLPEGLDLEHLDFYFGGLLSTGVVGAKDYAVPTSFAPTDDNDLVDYDTVTPVGGSIFNSLGLTLSGPAVPLPGGVDLVSHPIGPLGAWIGESQIVGILLGDGWDDTGAKHEPFPENATGPALPPLLNLIAPMLPDDFFGDGTDGSGDGASGSTEAVTPFSDFVSGGDTLGDWLSF